MKDYLGNQDVLVLRLDFEEKAKQRVQEIKGIIFSDPDLTERAKKLLQEGDGLIDAFYKDDHAKVFSKKIGYFVSGFDFAEAMIAAGEIPQEKYFDIMRKFWDFEKGNFNVVFQKTYGYSVEELHKRVD